MRATPAIDVIGHQRRADHELELVRRRARGIRRLAGVRGVRRGEKPGEDMRWARGKTQHGGLRCGWRGSSVVSYLTTTHRTVIRPPQSVRMWVRRCSGERCCWLLTARCLHRLRQLPYPRPVYASRLRTTRLSEEAGAELHHGRPLAGRPCGGLARCSVRRKICLPPVNLTRCSNLACKLPLRRW